MWFDFLLLMENTTGLLVAAVFSSEGLLQKTQFMKEAIPLTDDLGSVSQGGQ
jgi:hypothetical protein